MWEGGTWTWASSLCQSSLILNRGERERRLWERSSLRGLLLVQSVVYMVGKNWPWRLEKWWERIFLYNTIFYTSSFVIFVVRPGESNIAHNSLKVIQTLWTSSGKRMLIYAVSWIFSTVLALEYTFMLLFGMDLFAQSVLEWHMLQWRMLPSGMSAIFGTLYMGLASIFVFFTMWNRCDCQIKSFQVMARSVAALSMCVFRKVREDGHQLK